MRTKDSPGPAGAVNDDTHATDDAMVGEQGGAGEAGFRAEVLDDDRLVGQQRVTSLRTLIHFKYRLADEFCMPANPGAQEERPTIRQQLEHLAELNIEDIRDEPDGGIHQFLEVAASKRAQPERGDRLLFAGSPLELPFVTGSDVPTDTSASQPLSLQVAPVAT